MLGVFAILLIGLYMAFLFPVFKKAPAAEETSDKDNVRVKKLWGIAQVSMRERKPLRAEKALLAILKLDEKNAAAYNRLGILYAKGKKFDEAIECFEIAQSLDNNASSLHNVGLIYLETGEYEKAAMAFTQAIELEGDMPARYIALAKANEKIGNKKAALEALESAYNLDKSLNTLRQILAIHEAAEDVEAITATQARIEKHMAENAEKRKAENRRSMRAQTRQARLSAKQQARMNAARARQQAQAAKLKTRQQAQAARLKARQQALRAQQAAAKAKPLHQTVSSTKTRKIQ